MEWIHKGIQATRDQHPGLAADLRNELFHIHQQKQDWPVCASIRTEEFFADPNIQTYTTCKKAVEKAKL